MGHFETQWLAARGLPLAKMRLIPGRRDPIVLPLERNIKLVAERIGNSAPAVAYLVWAACKTGARDDLKNGCGTIYDLQGGLGRTSVKTTEVYLAHLTPEKVQAIKFARTAGPQKEPQKAASATA